jgi:hypothetical protein
MTDKVVYWHDLRRTGWLRKGKYFPDHIVSYCEVCKGQHSHILIRSDYGEAVYSCVGCDNRQRGIIPKES